MRIASLEIGYRVPSGFKRLSSSAILEYVLQAVAYGSFFFGITTAPTAAPPAILPPTPPVDPASKVKPPILVGFAIIAMLPADALW